ncbi:MAG: hypothetical protein IKN67_00510 [Alphaproteobacteria bacterium]|nr:hypothetical protein [Alphaproteobacteria bacterium]
MMQQDKIEVFLKDIEPILKEFSPEEQESFKKYVRNPQTKTEKDKIDLTIKSVNSALDLENKVYADGEVTETEKYYLKTTRELISGQIASTLRDAVRKYAVKSNKTEEKTEPKQGVMHKIKSFLQKIGLPMAIAAIPMAAEAHDTSPDRNKPKVSLSVVRENNDMVKNRVHKGIKQARENRLESQTKTQPRQTTIDFGKIDKSNTK